MAVDTSIYNALAPRVKSVAEFDAEAQDAQMRKQNMLLNALGIQQQQQALAMNQQKMADARAEREQMSGLGQWLATADTKSPDFAAQVYQRAPMAAGGFLKDFAARDKEAAAAGKSRAEMEKEQLATTKTRLDLILQATSSAKDQASYTQARNLLESHGIDVTRIPEQFDPAYVAAAGQQAMTQAQRLEQVWKQKGYDLDVRRADDMVRHQRATEGLQARGQNMADARSRELNDINRQAARSQVLETPNGVMIVDKGTGLARPAATMNGAALPGKQPESVKKELTSIGQQRAVIDGALDAVANTPSAFSFGRGTATRLGGTAETIAGRFDTDAQSQARSYVYNNVSKIINERAGAAQSAQELARLRGFLPAEQDDARQVRNKLNAFKSYLSDLERGTKGDGQASPAPSKAVNWGDLK